LAVKARSELTVERIAATDWILALRSFAFVAFVRNPVYPLLPNLQVRPHDIVRIDIDQIRREDDPGSVRNSV
jgi:hypothetical protein